MSTKSLDQIKKEMQARLTELQPLVEEAQHLEAILEADRSYDRPRRVAAERAPARATRGRSTGRRRARHGRDRFNSFEHRVNSYYKRMREELPAYFTLSQFASGAVFDQRNEESMAAIDYLVDNGYIYRLEVDDVPHAGRPRGWWLANNLYAVVNKQQKVQFTQEEVAIG